MLRSSLTAASRGPKNDCLLHVAWDYLIDTLVAPIAFFVSKNLIDKLLVWNG